MNDLPHDINIAYTKSARAKIIVLNLLWEIAVRNNWTPQVADALAEFVFRIKGSGGSYGYSSLTDAADRLYALIRESDLPNIRISAANEARKALERELRFVARPLTVVSTTTDNRRELDC